MFTYAYNILHIFHIKTYVKSFFTILEPNIHAPPLPSPNPTLISNWLVRILFILESFCTDRNFFLDMYYLIKKILNGWLAYKSKKKTTKQTNVIKKENITAIKWYVLPSPAHKITAYGQKNPAELSFEICYNQFENISSY